MRLKLTKTEPFICVCIYKFIARSERKQAKETTDHVILTNAHTNQMGIVFKWYISFKRAKSFFRLLIFAIQFWMSRKFKCSHVIQHKLYDSAAFCTLNVFISLRLQFVLLLFHSKEEKTTKYFMNEQEWECEKSSNAYAE